MTATDRAWDVLSGDPEAVLRAALLVVRGALESAGVRTGEVSALVKEAKSLAISQRRLDPSPSPSPLRRGFDIAMLWHRQGGDQAALINLLAGLYEESGIDTSRGAVGPRGAHNPASAGSTPAPATTPLPPVVPDAPGTDGELLEIVGKPW